MDKQDDGTTTDSTDPKDESDQIPQVRDSAEAADDDQQVSEEGCQAQGSEKDDKEGSTKEDKETEEHKDEDHKVTESHNGEGPAEEPKETENHDKGITEDHGEEDHKEGEQANGNDALEDTPEHSNENGNGNGNGTAEENVTPDSKEDRTEENGHEDAKPDSTEKTQQEHVDPAEAAGKSTDQALTKKSTEESNSPTPPAQRENGKESQSSLSTPTAVVKRDDCTRFMVLALKNIIPLCSKRFATLKEYCVTLLSTIDPEAPGQIHFPGNPSAGLVHPTQVYVYVLRLACETGDLKIIQTALDCMHKILSFGVVNDTIPGSLPLIVFAKRSKMPIPPHDEMDENDKPQPHPWKGQKTGLLTELVSAVCGVSCYGTSLSDTIILPILKPLLTAATENQLHGYALRMVVSTIFQLTVMNTQGSNNITAKTTLTQVVNSIFVRIDTATLQQDQETLTIYHNDASIVFQYICGLPETVDVTEYTASETNEMRVILSSLTLIQKLLSSSGTSFSKNKKFMGSIKKSLIYALIKACSSSVPVVVKQGLQIFATLIAGPLCYTFRQEVGIIFEEILTHILDSKFSSSDQKLLVADALQSITTRSQLLVELFVNYDCALHQTRLFEKLMDCLSRLLMTPNTDLDLTTPRQDNEIKLMAVQNVVSTLRSLHQWISQKRFPEVPKTHIACTTSETEKLREKKNVIEECAVLFNKKPKKGAALLVSKGVCEDNPKALAVCFETLKELDRDMVGEYLGELEDYNLSVLHEFCSIYDMSEMSLDEALRNFLSRFALPKEGQKIERILEHFSDAFYEHHPTGTCRTGEAVFVLAVGIVMLNTDLHNPQIEKKMTVTRFIAQFKGVNDGEDFDAQYLKKTYSNIRSNPIMDVQLAAQMEGVKVTEERSGQLFSAFSSKRDRKAANYVSDMQKVSSHVRSLLAGVPTDLSNGEALFPTSPEHVKSMFGVCWAPLLAAFSLQFEQRSTDPNDQNTIEILKLCIDGITAGIHIASHFEFHTERESYMRSLCTMTKISSKKSPIPGSKGLIQDKNILAIRALLKVPLTDAELLLGSWLPYLRIVSEVEYYRSLGVQLRRSQNVNKHDDAIDEEHLIARAVSVNVEEHAIHKIISHTSSISQAGLKEFAEHLCTVALEEINLASPRRFLLEKTVEVVSENMGPRLLAVWKYTSKLLVAVGTHQNSDIAEYGVDSLRQLVVKSITKEELLQCKIQPELLLPFHGVMSSSLPSKQVRDLVLRCVLQLVEARPQFICSGWPVVMKILTASITRHKDTTAIEVVADIMSKVLSVGILESVIPYLSDVVDCVVFLIQNCNRTPEISKSFATLLSNLPLEVASCQPDNGAVESAWDSVFTAFSYLILLPDTDIQKHCIAVFGNTLSSAMTSKQTFPDSAWSTFATTFAVDSVLRPLDYGTISLRKAESFRHFVNNEITGHIEVVTSDVFGSSILSSVLDSWFVHPLSTVQLSGRSQIHLSHLVAVLCKLCKRDSMKHIHLSVEKLEVVLCSKSVVGLLDEEGWHVITEHLRNLFKHSVLRTTLLKRFSTSSEEEDDCVNNQSEFPDNCDLCPAEVDTLRADDENSWAAILYGHEEGASLSYYAEENVVISDLNLRYARQAGILSVLEKLLASNDVLVDWTKTDSPLHHEDYLHLFECVKYCHSTAKVFFSESFDRWRRNLQPETLEMVRRRRSKAVQLNMVLLFKGYSAENKQLSDHARTSLLPDALLLVNDYFHSSERSCLEQPLTSVASHLLDLNNEDFKVISDVFYAPLCRCLELDGSGEVRKAIVQFLLRAHPT